jgi:hypothetical protein
MRRAIKLLALAALAAFALVPSFALSDPILPIVVDVQPGMTQLEVSGEQYLVVTTTALRLYFDCVSDTRTIGRIQPLVPSNSDRVKLIWLSYGAEPLTLYDGNGGFREWRFDSDQVTGHNEKYE